MWHWCIESPQIRIRSFIHSNSVKTHHTCGWCLNLLSLESVFPHQQGTGFALWTEAFVRSSLAFQASDSGINGLPELCLARVVSVFFFFWSFVMNINLHLSFTGPFCPVFFCWIATFCVWRKHPMVSSAAWFCLCHAHSAVWKSSIFSFLHILIDAST